MNIWKLLYIQNWACWACWEDAFQHFLFLPLCINSWTYTIQPWTRHENKYWIFDWWQNLFVVTMGHHSSRFFQKAALTWKRGKRGMFCLQFVLISTKPDEEIKHLVQGSAVSRLISAHSCCCCPSAGWRLSCIRLIDVNAECYISSNCYAQLKFTW